MTHLPMAEALTNAACCRHEAEIQRGQLQRRLVQTQEELNQEQEMRTRSQHDALALAVERERLRDALKVERMIK